MVGCGGMGGGGEKPIYIIRAFLLFVFFEANVIVWIVRTCTRPAHFDSVLERK